MNEQSAVFETTVIKFVQMIEMPVFLRLVAQPNEIFQANFTLFVHGKVREIQLIYMKGAKIKSLIIILISGT